MFGDTVNPEMGKVSYEYERELKKESPTAWAYWRLACILNVPHAMELLKDAESISQTFCPKCGREMGFLPSQFIGKVWGFCPGCHYRRPM